MNTCSFLFQEIILDGPLLSKIQNILQGIAILKVLRWILLCSGLLLVGYGYYLYFHNKKMFQVSHTADSPTKSSTSEQKSSSEIAKTGIMTHTNFPRNAIMTGHEFDKYKT